jgi:DNA polymerase I-like protein with 3'-5' exonuclease and polymerase domains
MLTIDIETDMKHSVIWCACAEDVETGAVTVHTEAKTLQALVNEHDGIVTYNGLGFDVPVMQRLWDMDFTGKKHVDAMVLSRLYNPAQAGGHSLRSWGDRLAYPKDDFTDYDGGLCEEMITYCKRDVQLTTKVYKKLLQAMEKDKFTQDVIDLEHRVTAELELQRQNGFKIDLPKANELYSRLSHRMREIEGLLQTEFPPIVTERYSEKTGKRLKDSVEVFNVGSRQQIAKRLQSIGIRFTDKTEGGSYKIDENVLEAIDNPSAQLVAEYLLVQKRASQVSSWLEAVEADGRVHGRVFSSGAATGRMTHISPNMAQVPATRKVLDSMTPVQKLKATLGGECRACWTVDEGNKLVGIDASGLELRMLAHYMKDEDYVQTILEGDIHSANQAAAGLETRDQAKTFIYAFLYGAGDEKIGSIAGKGAAHGKKLKKDFLDNIPSLKVLKTTVENLADKNGSLPSLDGRRIRIRKAYSALNFLLQGGGAALMKKALLNGVDSLREVGIPFKIVANVHDELQVETPEAYAKAVGLHFRNAIRKAGDDFGLRCPMDGEFQIGNNWSETH